MTGTAAAAQRPAAPHHRACDRCSETGVDGQVIGTGFTDRGRQDLDDPKGHVTTGTLLSAPPGIGAPGLVAVCIGKSPQAGQGPSPSFFAWRLTRDLGPRTAPGPLPAVRSRAGGVPDRPRSEPRRERSANGRPSHASSVRFRQRAWRDAKSALSRHLANSPHYFGVPTGVFFLRSAAARDEIQNHGFCGDEDHSEHDTKRR